jgi:hypothetical protein
MCTNSESALGETGGYSVRKERYRRRVHRGRDKERERTEIGHELGTNFLSGGRMVVYIVPRLRTTTGDMDIDRTV